MKTYFNYTLAIFILFSILSCSNMNKQNNASSFPEAPKAEKQDCVLTVHDHSRVDPYFWMRLTDEQKNAEKPDGQTQKVLNYLNSENDYQEKVMEDTKDLQSKLYNEIVGRIKQNDSSAPYSKNGYWYYVRYEEGLEYPIYCRKKESLEAKEEIMLNVNELAEGFEYYNVTGLKVSPDNKILAFGEDTLSRRIYNIRFLNLETGEFYNDIVENTTGSGAWAGDNKTYFFTTKDKVSLLSNKIWRHKLGTTCTSDVMVYHEKDPSFYIGVYGSKSGDYVFIYNQSTLVSDYHVLKTDNPEGEFMQITKREEDHKYYLDHYKNKFYIRTNWEAQNFRLMEVSINNTAKANWNEVIPHRSEVLLQGVEVFEKYLVLSERSNALPQIRVIDQNSKEEHYLEFNEQAYVTYVWGNADFNTEYLRFAYSSMTTPESDFDYNMKTKEQILRRQEEVVGGHNPDEYETKRLFATASDGEKIPISLVYKKGIEINGETPLVLYAYGSYGHTIDPGFRSNRLSLLNRGFIWAIAHIRGGQSKGRDWYEKGKLLNKKNTFTDYIDCAKYLIDEKYTSSDHLYGIGGSAGGLLIGAVSNMAPEKFNGLIAAVPFVDVVSTMLDETIPLTTNEFDEWGNPKNKEYYEYMLSYSPYDQVEEKEYPHLLITTGLFDSQVQYWEPAKWIAKLRDKKTDDNLLIMNTNMDAGHGGSSGRFKRHKETALDYAFFLKLEGI